MCNAKERDTSENIESTKKNLESYFAGIREQIINLFKPVWNESSHELRLLSVKEVYSKDLPKFLKRYFPLAIVEQLMVVHPYYFIDRELSLDNYVNALNERYKEYLNDALSYNVNMDWVLTEFPGKVKKILGPVYDENLHSYGYTSKMSKEFSNFLKSVFPESLVKNLLDVRMFYYQSLPRYTIKLINVCEKYDKEIRSVNDFIKSCHVSNNDKPYTVDEDWEIHRAQQAVKEPQKIIKDAMSVLRHVSVREGSRDSGIDFWATVKKFGAGHK